MIKYMNIIPDYDTGTVKVKLYTDKKTAKAEYSLNDGGRFIRADLNRDDNSFEFYLEGPHAWTIEDPYLYTLSLKAEFEDGTHQELSDSFGVRKLSVADGKILLNNKPFYMRAYIRGTICHDHQNLCGLSQSEFYEKSIKNAKAFGFNTIRFHSKIPPRACFEVADRLGMFIHIEMRNADEEYDNLSEMIGGNNIFPSDETIKSLVLTLMNHPSFMVYCIGNEIKHPGVNPRVEQIAKLIKELDPSRLFIDTCAHGEFDRDYVEFDVQHMAYYYPFGKHYDMFENTDNLIVYGSCKGAEMTAGGENGGAEYRITRGIEATRPVIAHEVCHYTALRDIFGLEKKFEKYGKEKPWWIDEQKKMLKAKGFTERFYTMYHASKRFQLMSWKLALEAIRRSPILNGFHMLQFADTDRYENSNGIVDCFDDINYITPEMFLKFNGDTVLLADLPRRTYFEKETVEIPVYVSNYSQKDFSECDFEFELTDIRTKKTALSGRFHNISLEKSGLYKVLKLHITFPPVDAAAEYKLSMRVVPLNGENVISNDWSLWCFENKPEKLDTEGCGFALSSINAALRYRQIKACPDARVLVTDTLDENVFDALERGKSVLLFYRADATRHLVTGKPNPKYAFRATWERFKAVIWDRGTNYGGIVNKPAALSGFPHGNISDFVFGGLIEDSDKIILDDFPVSVTPIFEGIDKSVRDRFDVRGRGFSYPDFVYDRTLRRFGYIFELKVGAGKLLVSGLNFAGVGAGIPEVCGMFETLINYVKSDAFTPSDSISLGEFIRYLSENGKKDVVRERMMTQFWQLDNAPVESAEYWKASKEYILEGESE
jgi:hypothetical protein